MAWATVFTVVCKLALILNLLIKKDPERGYSHLK